MEDRLIQLFLQIINMSITAGYVILAVLLIRLLLKKAPKKYSYALWSVVAFRLCCPVSFKSSFSLFSLQFFDMSKAQQESAAALRYIPENIGMMAQPEVTVGIPYANTIITDSLPAATPMYSANPMQIWTAIGAYLWCIGVVGLLLYSIISYLWLHHKMRNAVLLEGNVFQSDTIRSPFMLGIIRPKIYIPFGLEKQAYGYVLTHEQYHLKRKDHIIKPLAFLLLIIHWFNPLCWLAFGLMSRDMEMSCDEKVLAGEENIRKAYSAALLAFAVNKRFPSPNPLAFGETDVKKRIRNILNWKKPALWITVVAVLLCISVLIACAANPLEKKENTANTVTGTYGAIWAEKEYCVEQIIYDAPVYSFTYNIETAPGYYLTESGKLMVRGDILIADDDDWKALGTCKEFTLTEDNFDACFLDYEGNGPDWRVQNDLRKLREENELAW